MFLDWLCSKDTQKDMTGEGRNFRRKTAKFWDIWAMPPKIEELRETVYVDGIYLARKACIPVSYTHLKKTATAAASVWYKLSSIVIVFLLSMISCICYAHFASIA